LNVRDWLHVDDHCRGIQLVADLGRPGEIYNIGGGTELTNRELTYRLVAALGADESMIQPVMDRKAHERRYSVDITKITTELGYEPLVPFDEGLASTIRWYQDNRSWWEPLKEAAALPGY
jgi:dTDP-glucose 4,6-dehydratase